MFEFMKQDADASPAKPSATVVVVRDGADGIEALLLQRNPELAVMGGAWVFPGGKVDADDLGDSEECRARHAAVRELREEASLEVAADQLSVFSHWLTPVVVKARFSAWFYLVPMTGAPEVVVDDSEIVAYRWITASNALEENRQGELRLPPPTLVSLIDIASHHNVATLVSAVQQRQPPRFFPRILKQGDDLLFLYPGDAGYDDSDAEAQGPRHRSMIVSGQFSYQRDFDWPLRAEP